MVDSGSLARWGRLVCPMALAVLCGSNTYAQQDEYHFRHVRWGMSREEVVATEQVPAESDSEDSLAFRSRGFGEGVIVVYTFSSNRLTAAKYVFAKCAPSPASRWMPVTGECLYAFVRLKKRLTKRYGDPVEVGTRSTATRLRFLDRYLSPKDRGTRTELEWAARRGEAAWYTCWKASHSQITLFLDGGGGMLDLRVEYRPAEDQPQPAASNPSP